MDIRSVSSAATPAPAAIDRDAASTARAAAPAASAPAPAQAAAAVSGSRPDAKTDGLDEAISHINKSMQASNQGVEFAVDEDSKRLVVKVVDQETREVLRQMPSVEALEIAKALDRAKGLLIRQEA